MRDETADTQQKARAARLRAQIERLKEGRPAPGSGDQLPDAPPSPREFVERRMREIEVEEQGED